MSDTGSWTDRIAAAKFLPPSGHCPRVLITGACSGIGHACAEAIAATGAELILCDKDVSSLAETARKFGAADHFHCDVASDHCVEMLATEVLSRYPSLDMVINAAGGGYERTLGMYRVSRALLPGLRDGVQKLLINVPPSATEAEAPIFPYASSRHGFQRLSSALAFEARGTSVTVMIACPARRKVAEVAPDPNAGTWGENGNIRQPTRDDLLALARQIASLLGSDAELRRHAG